MLFARVINSRFSNRARTLYCYCVWLIFLFLHFPGEGGEGEEPPAGYQEDDGGCPEDDEDEEEEEEEGVSGGSSGSPPRSPIPSSTDVEQDAANERLPLRLVPHIIIITIILLYAESEREKSYSLDHHCGYYYVIISDRASSRYICSRDFRDFRSLAHRVLHV